MAEGARIAEGAGAEIIDINMGCPAKHVANRQSGSALMRDLDHALTLIEATVGAVARAGDAEDAARLGRPLDQRARACAARGGRRRPHDHRARPHALPVLHGHGRLGRGARRQGRDFDSARRQRRHHAASTTPTRRSPPPAPTPSWSAARAQGRPWFPGQIARYLETGRREAAPPLATQFALIAALYDEMLAHHGLRIGLQARPQASRLGARRRGRDRRRRPRHAQALARHAC